MGISNAFYGTKLIVDNDFPAVKDYRTKYALTLIPDSIHNAFIQDTNILYIVPFVRVVGLMAPLLSWHRVLHKLLDPQLCL